jgi:flagellar protein FlaG
MEAIYMDIDAIRTAPVTVITPQQKTAVKPVENQTTANTAVTAQQTKEAERPADNDVIAAKLQKNTRREEEASLNTLQTAIDTANKQLIHAQRMMQANVHEKTNRIHVKIIDTETEEVVREIPPEKTLDLFAKVLEMAGLLLDEVK